jgi:hypothetical protein
LEMELKRELERQSFSGIDRHKMKNYNDCSMMFNAVE